MIQSSMRSRYSSLSSLTSARLQFSKRFLSTNSSSSNNNNNNNRHKLPVILHPYSQSLPSPGYEWCTRCGIRSHDFQKRIGQHHACLDLPRRIPFLRSGICGGAQNYYRKQMNYMLLLTAAIFGLLPILGVDCDDDDDVDVDNVGGERRYD